MGLKKGVSSDPTLMLKLVAGEFELIHKIGFVVKLPLFERLMEYL